MFQKPARHVVHKSNTQAHQEENAWYTTHLFIAAKWNTIPCFRSENAALSLPCTLLFASLSNAQEGQREPVHEYGKEQNLLGKFLNLQLAQNQELCNMPSMKTSRHKHKQMIHHIQIGAHMYREKELAITKRTATHSRILIRKVNLDQHTKTLYKLSKNGKGGDNVKHTIPVHQQYSTSPPDGDSKSFHCLCQQRLSITNHFLSLQFFVPSRLT